MQVQEVYLICHGLVTLIALIGLAIRLEHRLTKIETDVFWIKQRVQWEIAKEAES